ncbi:MAG: hypothetical protein P4L28_07150 [Paludibacteraceae bacterium]|nr:hypothetical protein [Paludibacteraceae bacterium]
MNTEKILDENGQGFTRFFSNDNVEKVNPVKYYKTHELKKRAIILRDLLKAKDPSSTSSLNEKFFIEKAEETLTVFFEHFEQTKVHNNFIELLKTTKKKDQEKLLKGMTLNPDELMSLIFKSYNDFGFLYSKYLFENCQNGFEEKKLPKFVHIEEDGAIKKVGETDLTNGELKNLIKDKKAIVAHFFEKDEFWHCFFLTYNSIKGEERGKNGQAHLHYVSSSFGISKTDFIESMKTGKHKSTPIHIALLDYGNQTEVQKKMTMTIAGAILQIVPVTKLMQYGFGNPH